MLLALLHWLFDHGIVNTAFISWLGYYFGWLFQP
jgi:hypothetical protein